jgi:hypothetical protein
VSGEPVEGVGLGIVWAGGRLAPSTKPYTFWPVR